MLAYVAVGGGIHGEPQLHLLADRARIVWLSTEPILEDVFDPLHGLSTHTYVLQVS